MYEYKFVRVELGGIFTRKPKTDHHRLVEEYAKEGWRLVQIFSPAVQLVGEAFQTTSNSSSKKGRIKRSL